MPKCKYLFDASSLVHALKLKRLDLLSEGCIQWLTVYEVLNAVWKEAHLLGKLDRKRAVEFVDALAEFLGTLSILDPRGCEKEAVETALEFGVTVYDASYVVLARKHGLVLVTEDRELRRKVGRAVEVVSLEELLGQAYRAR
ncbi:MAG: type II toxin-antitoxin system VapC family toxin [Thermofilaceae archaeon]